MAIADVLVQVVVRFGQVLAAPLKNPDMLWILIPIYVNWIFTDYLQERKGTDFGNAITNGVIQLWVGMDWIRQAIKQIEFSALFVTKAIICMISMVWGLLIMVEGARAKPITHYIGRVREVSYFMIVATPIFYGVIAPDLITIAAVLLFFPIWYVIGEAFDRLMPAPPGEEESLGAVSSDLKMPDMGAGAGMPEMPSGGGDLGQMPKMPKF
jgi:hypothetical protein